MHGWCNNAAPCMIMCVVQVLHPSHVCTARAEIMEMRHCSIASAGLAVYRARLLCLHSMPSQSARGVRWEPAIVPGHPLVVVALNEFAGLLSKHCMRMRALGSLK